MNTHHQQIETGWIAVLGLIHPIIPRIGAEEDDLEDLAILPTRRRRLRDRLGEFLHQHALDTVQLVPLNRGQVIDIPSHRRNLRRPGRSWQGLACRSRSEEHTSELQSLMRLSYAVFCLQKKTHKLN